MRMNNEIKVEIHGWKGKDELEILDEGIVYRVIEHRKNKETKETYSNEHLIPKVNVDTLWALIQIKCKICEKYPYKYLVRMILNQYRFHEKENQSIDMFMEAFNGGRNRAKYYFPYLYYPLKVLEAQGLIKHCGGGGIIRADNMMPLEIEKGENYLWE